MKNLVIILTVIAANIVATNFCFANESISAATFEGDIMSGVIYTDLNGNGVQDQNEPVAPNAVVNIQAEQSDVIESLIADEKGAFDTGKMLQARYSLWTEDGSAIQLSYPASTTIMDGFRSNPVIDLTNDVESSDLGTVANLHNDIDSVEIDSAIDLSNDTEMIQIQSVLLPFVAG